MHAPKVDQTMEEEFARDWRSGMLHRDLASKYGCASVTITATAKRLGLTPRKQAGVIESDLEGEEWRPVVGYEGTFEVSNMGRVRNARSQRQRRFGASRSYYNIHLARNDNPSVHVVVAAAFLGPRPEGMFVCHNNGDPHDNRASNLRYDTPRSNSLDAVRHGANWCANKTHCKHGHPFDEANTRLDSEGRRACRQCAREATRKRRRSATAA